MSELMDDYTKEIFQFLDSIPSGKTYTVDKLCKQVNRQKFIQAVKHYMDSYPYQGGVSFITEKYERFRKMTIPEAALEELNQ